MTLSFVGSMVPFSMRILQAELPQYMGRPRDALDNLYALQRTCFQVQENLLQNLTEDGSQGEMTPECKMGKPMLNVFCSLFRLN